MGNEIDRIDTGKQRQTVSRLGRILFGLGIALQASEDFRDMEDNVEYAESAGVPVPEIAAPLGSGTALLGGLAIAAWRLPKVATGAVVTFLAIVTPTMHDFWNKEDAGGERLAFFGNLAMLGAAIAFLREAYR
ncbi:MAG: DoxX family protein [Halobacteriales archaeon]|nr:DoxX family protein [Halobacteriales archaeon]